MAHKRDTTSIMLAGVGGQGTILAAKVLSEGLTRMGYDVKMSEIHGMSQRGGSVTSHVRFGSRVDSPVIPLGGADCLCGFEKLEALRCLPYLKQEGVLIVNDLEIYPLPVLIGAAEYPQDVLQRLTREAEGCLILDAHGEAEQLGTSRVENILLLGALIHRLDLDGFPWKEVLQDLVKPAFVEMNLEAFALGRSLA